MTSLDRRYNYEKIFIALMTILISLFITEFVSDFTGNQANVFFAKTGNYMADYYNVAKYSISKDPYLFGQQDPLAHEHAYPPLAYMIFYFLGNCANYVNLDAFSAGRGTTMGIATSSFFMFLSSAILYVVIYDTYNGNKLYKFLLSTVLFMSSIFIFSYERGNIIILAAVCLFFFILNYKNPNKFIRELSYISLAIAAALKAYPAIFGILLLFDKRYKDAIRLIIYGILFTFLPFLFFKGGFNNIPIWLNNLSANSKAYNYALFPRFNFRLWGSSILDIALKEQIYNILKIVDLVLCGLGIFASYFHKKEYKLILQLILCIIILPVNSAEYVGLYLFLGIILFFNEERKNKFDWVYLILFVFILNPYQIIYRGTQEWNITVMLMNLSASIMLVLLTTESLIILFKSMNKRSNKFCKQ